MVDDEDNAAPDPWADLGEQEGADGLGAFNFSFDPEESLEAQSLESQLPEEFVAPESAEELPPSADEFFAIPAVSEEIAPTAEAESEIAAEPSGDVADSSAEVAAESPSNAEADADEIFDDIADWLSAPAAPETEAAMATDVPDQASESLIEGSSIQIGTGESGLMAESGSLPFSEEIDQFGGDQAEAVEQAVEEPVEQVSEWPVDDWSAAPAATEADPGLEGFGIEHAAAAAGFGAMAVSASAASDGAFPAAVVPGTPSTARKAKKSGGGAFGAIIGGVLSVPIVLLILLGVFWGTGRDPIGFRSWLPRFLLPASARASARQVASVAKPADAPPTTLDSLTSIESTESATDDVTEPEMDESESTDESPSVEAGSLDGLSDVAASIDDEAEPLMADDAEETADPALDSVPDVAIESPLLASAPTTTMRDLDTPAPPPAPAEPPPLDLSGLESAVESALASTDTVLAGQADSSDRRKRLVAWYKDLARVGEELAMLETVAADSGRPLTETPRPVLDLYGRIVAADSVAADLKRLCRNWVDFAKRPADGVMLVGQFVSTRQTGPYWHTSVAIEQADGSPREVVVISRRAPRAEPGERAVVAGVVFSGDVVWAADCGPLEAAPAADELPF